MCVIDRLTADIFKPALVQFCLLGIAFLKNGLPKERCHANGDSPGSKDNYRIPGLNIRLPAAQVSTLSII